jgi:hypothetical protein
METTMPTTISKPRSHAARAARAANKFGAQYFVQDNHEQPGDWAHYDDPRSRMYVENHLADPEHDKFNRWVGRRPSRIELSWSPPGSEIWIDEARLFGFAGVRIRDVMDGLHDAEIRIDADTQRRQIRALAYRWWMELPRLADVPIEFEVSGSDVTPVFHPAEARVLS